MTLLRPSVRPNAGRATTTPARAGTHLMLLSPGTPGTAAGSRRITSSHRYRSRSTKCDCPSCRSRRAQLNPDPAVSAATPATPQTAPREEALDRLKKNLARSCTTDGSTDKNSSSCSRSNCNQHFRNSRRLRDNRLSTLLLISSGQPSFLASRAGEAGSRPRDH